MRQLSTRERVGLVVVFGLLCFGAGRFAAPARVEDHVVTVDKVRLKVDETQHTKTETKAVENKAETTDDTKEKVVRFKRTKKPDGTVTEEGEIIYRQRTTASLASQLQLGITSTVDLHRTTAVEEEHTRKEDHIVVNEQPRVLLGLGAGGAFSLSPLSVSPTYAALVSYRFLGPVNAWGMVAVTPEPLKVPRLTGLLGVAISL